MKYFLIKISVFLLVLSSAANAQATRTWVSGVGDDINPCSRTEPCKTFAGAISKTAAGGEISVLDPGGFGAVTITKSITLNGAGTLAGILHSGTNGIVINGSNVDVILKDLYIHGGTATGLDGVRILNARNVTILNSDITSTAGDGIDVFAATSINLTVKNTNISGTNRALVTNTSSGRIKVSIDDSNFTGNVNGVNSISNSTINIKNSNISQNIGAGILAEGGIVSAVQTSFTGNGTAAFSQVGATIRLSKCSILDNLAGMACGSGALLSSGDNLNAGNTGGIPTCPPTGSLSFQ